MSQNKKLSIAFYWHMHQPVYQLSSDGDFLMPWVRLHAVKDYLDMVTILDGFKNIKLNFNLFLHSHLQVSLPRNPHPRTWQSDCKVLIFLHQMVQRLLSSFSAE